MNAEDRVIMCEKFKELRDAMRWQTAVLVAIAAMLGLELPALA